MTPQNNSTIVLVTSTEDPASTNIAERLREKHAFRSTEVALFEKPVYQKDSLLLVTIDTRIVTPPDLDAYFNPQAYIFLSRHRAESGIASVTAHTTGNFTEEAALGGKPREIGRVNPDILKNYMLSLWKHSEELGEFQVTIEATHHGPTSLQKPVLFVEIGSGESSWKDERVGGIIADALMESLTSGRTWKDVAIAFGGTHYPDKFNRMILETETALASIAPKYALNGVDEPMFAQLIQKSTHFPGAVAIDWKGVGTHKERLLGLAKQFGLQVIRV